MRIGFTRNLTTFALALTMLVLPLATLGQGTQIKLPKNKYKIEDDVKIGQEYSAKVEQEMPIIKSVAASNYLRAVGNRLTAAIPPEYQDSRYRFQFKIVNASDVNAFALPGGPMYVNRGLIQVAKNEGEMVGVMAHEISHVVLRHGTAQATRQSGWTKFGSLAAILAGGVLGGQAGAQLGQALFAGTFILKYSRQYETNADILGARIMARAGYDPIDLANMFKTIASTSNGNRSPEWFSSHPDPQNRYNTIVRERNLLRLVQSPTKLTNGFKSTREYLNSLSPAQTASQIAKQRQNSNSNGRVVQQGGNSRISQGQYSRRVPRPSARYQQYRGGSLFTMNVPTNWQRFPESEMVWFAPLGAYGNNGITHGALVGVTNTGQNSLANASQAYVRGILRSNSYLRQTTRYSRISISGRPGYAVQLAGRSPITGANEYVTIYMTRLRDGRLFYFSGVAPSRESYRYNRTFNSLVRSIRINGRA